jgi:hypothetical protein
LETKRATKSLPNYSEYLVQKFTPAVYKFLLLSNFNENFSNRGRISVKASTSHITLCFSPGLQINYSFQSKSTYVKIHIFKHILVCMFIHLTRSIFDRSHFMFSWVRVYFFHYCASPRALPQDKMFRTKHPQGHRERIFA